jgi:hypothetical protein
MFVTIEKLTDVRTQAWSVNAQPATLNERAASTNRLGDLGLDEVDVIDNESFLEEFRQEHREDVQIPR